MIRKTIVILLIITSLGSIGAGFYYHYYYLQHSYVKVKSKQQLRKDHTVKNEISKLLKEDSLKGSMRDTLMSDNKKVSSQIDSELEVSKNSHYQQDIYNKKRKIFLFAGVSILLILGFLRITKTN